MGGFFNFQAASSEVTLCRYSLAVIIAATYPYLVPIGNYTCVVLVEVPILESLVPVFYIDAWVGQPITLVFFSGYP